jgi:hypothetical protein
VSHGQIVLKLMVNREQFIRMKWSFIDHCFDHMSRENELKQQSEEISNSREIVDASKPKILIYFSNQLLSK